MTSLLRCGVFVVLSAAVACASAKHPSDKPSPARFYTGKDFGSESQFNPLSEIINDGFDFGHTTSTDRHIFTRDYAGALGNVLKSVLQAERTIRQYGVARAARNEWFPLTGKDDSGGGSWIANYEFHFFGSGMVSVRLEEWYAQHGAAHPAFDAITTMGAAHLLNEVVENDTWRGLNQDAVTDLLLFDALGMAFWRIDAVQRFFSGPVQMTNWPWQPSIELNTGTLQNSGQQYVLRRRLPGTQRWRLIYLFGLGGALGLSHGDPHGGAWSAALGPYTETITIVDSVRNARTISLRMNAGIYYDRDGSLLFSANYAPRSQQAHFSMNVYPGVFRIGSFRPGLWLQTAPGRRIRLGIASRWGVGIGLGPSH